MFMCKLLSLKMSITLRVGHHAVLSAEIIREQRNAKAEKNLLHNSFYYALYH